MIWLKKDTILSLLIITFLLVGTGLATINVVQGSKNSSDFVETSINDPKVMNLNQEEENSPLNEDKQSPETLGPIIGTISNGTWYYGGGISSGTYHYYVLNNVLFNSANYYISGFESNPAAIDIEVYVKFSSIPSRTDYDYMASTSNQYEDITVEVPENDEYGSMYILIYCASGSDFYWVYAHSISDANGCWRSADYITTPNASLPDISLSGSVTETDKNDFYYLQLYSGQMLKIEEIVTTVGSSYVDLYLYDAEHNLLAIDNWANTLDIEYNLTGLLSSGNYFIRFRNMDPVKHDYSGTVSDENSDTNNRYQDAQEINVSPFPAWMDRNDFNDYFYFMVDSGEKITLNISIDDVLDDPHYDAFLYATGNPINDNYVKSEINGTSLIIVYYCGEYYSSEVQPGTQNKIYLRFWNAARHSGMADSQSGYTIRLTREWNELDDHMANATDYTTLGANDTSIKTGTLTGEEDINDWFNITTLQGYTIKIRVNSTEAPNPYLDGYLLNSTGHVMDFDTNFNISITYTARYNGSYFFRLYDAAAAYNHGSHSGDSAYTWYIYTTSVDGNDNFDTAEEVTPPKTIYSSVSILDIDDYYKFEVPSGFQIDASISSCGTLQGFLYNQSEHELGQDYGNSWTLTHQHKGIDTETYYVRVSNNDSLVACDYTLIITLSQIDGDGSMVGATPKALPLPGSTTGSGTLGGADINDYYSFSSQSGDKLWANVTGTDGTVVRFVKAHEGLEKTLVEGTIADGQPTIIEYYPHDFYPGETYYLRIGSPGGATANYDYNITRTEFDTDDGYYYYANNLDFNDTVTISDTLSDTDCNDWFIFNLDSGHRLDIDLTTTISDPHVGIQVMIAGWYEIFNDSQILHANYTNLYMIPYTAYIQVVNEAGTSGSYDLTITITAIDDDNNGSPDIAEDILLNSDQNDELSYNDINDYYAVEIRSGYNFTLHYNTSGFNGIGIYCLLYDQNGIILDASVSTLGTLNYFHQWLDPVYGYVQFYNYAPWVGFNETQSLGQYTWNATLVNDDPDGDFPNATTITRSEIKSDSLYVDISAPPFNFSDLNDFYKIDLVKGDVIQMSITFTGVTDPWFGVYIYNKDLMEVASATGSDALSLLYNVGSDAGTHYIRFYDLAFEPGDYTFTFAVHTDDDSYFEGATPVSPGHQTNDTMEYNDIVDFYSVYLGIGWRMKVNATVSGTTPGLDLLIYDPDEEAVLAEFGSVDYTQIEFTSEKNGTFYIQFYNSNGTSIEYEWWLFIYEDENGIFSTATAVGPGTIDDNVQEFDKYDYFVFTGISGKGFTISCSTNLTLELHLYNATESLVDSDVTSPGLAQTYTPSTGENKTFYILFYNPNGETGDYSFDITGVKELPGEEVPFWEEEIFGYPAWQLGAMGGGGLLFLLFIRKFIFRRGKKG